MHGIESIRFAWLDCPAPHLTPKHPSHPHRTSACTDLALADGDLFEDCPDLDVGYIHEPGRIEIRYVTPVTPAEREPIDNPRTNSPADPAAEKIAERVVTDAWRRVVRRLQRCAPDSYAALRTGMTSDAITALESDLGVRLPAGLRALWSLTGGDDGVDGVDGSGCLPGNQALMPGDAVAAFHRQQMDAQALQDTLNARYPAHDRITVWEPGWIPVVSYGVSDRTSGRYLDTATGYLGRWSRYDEAPDDELDTLATYLEGVADALEAPALATGDTPGLVGGALVWGGRIDPAQEDTWRPLAAD
ncbi:SMI1/KNR4 family protein [Streptomyces sp. NPDC093089]|uniref:SMI1/KNR4 family protein n=1 Tax=Streptomyces sp. NPDC093089 TaxID=3366024 RepID=UPI00382EE255